jgi:hypothetical protein
VRLLTVLERSVDPEFTHGLWVRPASREELITERDVIHVSTSGYTDEGGAAFRRISPLRVSRSPSGRRSTRKNANPLQPRAASEGDVRVLHRAHGSRRDVSSRLRRKIHYACFETESIARRGRGGARGPRSPLPSFAAVLRICVWVLARVLTRATRSVVPFPPARSPPPCARSQQLAHSRRPRVRIPPSEPSRRIRARATTSFSRGPQSPARLPDRSAVVLGSAVGTRLSRRC